MGPIPCVIDNDADNDVCRCCCRGDVAGERYPTCHAPDPAIDGDQACKDLWEHSGIHDELCLTSGEEKLSVSYNRGYEIS